MTGSWINTVRIDGELKHITELDAMTLSNEWSKLKTENAELHRYILRMLGVHLNNNGLAPFDGIKTSNAVSKQNYSYKTLTATTEKLMNKYIQDAKNNPEEAQKWQHCFGSAFWLWFDLTRDEEHPDRDTDGERFMNLQLNFPE